MLSFRDLLVHGRSFIQDTIDGMDFRVGSLASTFLDADKNSSDDVSNGNVANFNEEEKQKEFGDMDQNRNGVFPTRKKEGDSPNKSYVHNTNKITKEATAKLSKNHEVVLQANHTCSKVEQKHTENGYYANSEHFESNNREFDFQNESTDVKIAINDVMLAQNVTDDLVNAKMTKKHSLNAPSMFQNQGFYLNVAIPKRKLSYTEAILQNDMENYGMSSVLDMLSMDGDDKNGDDMNEMEMPNPGSIQHFERLFYPKVPCKNCSSCYVQYEDEIFYDQDY